MPKKGAHDVSGPFEGVGIRASDQNNISVVFDMLVAVEKVIAMGPGQHGLGTHIVIDQRTPEALARSIVEGSVKQVTVKQHHVTRLHLDSHRIVFGPWKSVGLF